MSKRNRVPKSSASILSVKNSSRYSDAIIAFSPMRAGGFAILGKRDFHGHGVTGKRPRIFEHQLPPGLRLRRRGGPGEELGRIRPRTSTTRADRLFPCPAREVGTQRRAGAARSDFAYPFSGARCLFGPRRTCRANLPDPALHLH